LLLLLAWLLPQPAEQDSPGPLGNSALMRRPPGSTILMARLSCH
jgi:hypothetical protein